MLVNEVALGQCKVMPVVEAYSLFLLHSVFVS